MNTRISENELLYFLHIPKTAGMTFTDFIKSHFAPCESNPIPFIDGLMKTPRKELDQYKFIAGHFYYNIDAFLIRKLIYITMLRDPVERTLSHYFHVRRAPTHPLYPKSHSLLDFVRDPAVVPFYANLQTRYIGLDRNFPEIEKMINKGATQNDCDQVQFDTPEMRKKHFDPAILERAQERLSNFKFFGITEQYDASIELLCQIFGWNVPETNKVINFGTNRPAILEVPQEALDIIKENTQLDAELYKAGKKLFNERYESLMAKPADKVNINADPSQQIISELRQKIDFQQRAINQLGEELIAIQESPGWRFILGFNRQRRKLIPNGSVRESVYLKVRALVSPIQK